MFKVFKQIPGGILVSWVALTLPLVWLAYDFLIQRSGGAPLFYWSGVFSIWLMLATLAVTPLIRLLSSSLLNRWLIIIRRHMGVAAFGYGLLHTVYWVTQKSVHDVLFSVFRQVTLVGWIALAIFIVMAVTSNDWSVRRMGPGWKTLQRWIYIGAPLTLWHWFISVNYRMNTVLIYGGILTILLGYRVWQRQVRTRRAGRS